MIHAQLEKYRDFELEQVLKILGPGEGRTLLDLGAGAGWQSRQLAGRGFAVEALDVEGSAYASQRVWKVKDYDGKTIPFPDRFFEVVYSSHVLVVVDDLSHLQGEIQRVLKPGGKAVHVLPTSTLRVWNNVAHYCSLCKLAVGFLLPWFRSSRGEAARLREKANSYSLREKIVKILTPHNLSPRGNFITQVYWFSRFFWVPFFRKSGWIVERKVPTHLFHTGYLVFDSMLPLSLRGVLSRVLGSSSCVYVLTQEQPARHREPEQV